MNNHTQPQLVTYDMPVVLPLPDGETMTVYLGWNTYVMYDPNSDDPTQPVDVANNLDTAITMIQEGYTAVAVNPNKQHYLDHERALYVDCYEKE